MKILNFSNSIFKKSYLGISVLGKNLKLSIKYTNTSKPVEFVKKENEIDLILPAKYRNSDNMEIINSAIEKLYTKLANIELESSLELARHILKFAPEDYKIKQLDDSYYKCIRNKILVISPDIMQYNRDIINTTILQAFCKIKYKVNSKAYKETLSTSITAYEKYKMQSNVESKLCKIS